MSEIAIKVQHLGKQYRLGGKQASYSTFRETLVNAAANPLLWLKGERKTDQNTFWALDDVSFEVNQGDAIGIIGRNGAGKSTLLKILSRITSPTRGRVDIYGRVGTLLEVGTGFHPELSGRENIYLNGAILGMSRIEIARKFDEIVAFSEIERFLDTPVKHYSSGMYVRLAFAVAAHLEPEILVVDEVLAVGDAAFQKKCLGKMGDVAHEGRTVLFVSHNMTAIQNLCKNCIFIDKGKINTIGPTEGIVKQYLLGISNDNHHKSETNPGIVNLNDRINHYRPGEIIINKISLLDTNGEFRDIFQMGQKMVIRVDIQNLGEFRDSMIGITIKSETDQWLASINTGMNGEFKDEERNAREQATLVIPHLPFTPNTYWISISAGNKLERFDYVDRAISFNVLESDVYGTGYQVTNNYGLIFLNGKWIIENMKDN
jgi:lipopolysaccharide transport system ATP-binding protein